MGTIEITKEQATHIYMMAISRQTWQLKELAENIQEIHQEPDVKHLTAHFIQRAAREIEALQALEKQCWKIVLEESKNDETS